MIVNGTRSIQPSPRKSPVEPGKKVELEEITLTSAQWTVLRLLTAGHRPQVVARMCGYSHGTVKIYLARMYAKLREIKGQEFAKEKDCFTYLIRWAALRIAGSSEAHFQSGLSEQEGGRCNAQS